MTSLKFQGVVAFTINAVVACAQIPETVNASCVSMSLLQTGFELRHEERNANAHSLRPVPGHQAIQSSRLFTEMFQLISVREILFFFPLLFFIVYMCTSIAMWRIRAGSCPPLRSFAAISVILSSSYGLVLVRENMSCFPSPTWSMAMGSLLTVMGLGTVVCACIYLATIGKRRSSASSTVTNAKQPRLLTLDGLRVLIISVIMIVHHRSWWPVHVVSISNQVNRIMHGSEPLLFIVSGFLTYHVSKPKVEHFDFGEGAAWVANRLARLIPAYQFSLALVLAQYLLFVSNLDVVFPMQSLMLHSLFPIDLCVGPGPFAGQQLAFAGVGQGWFTSAIVLLSLCFPVMYNLLRYLDYPGVLMSLLLCLLLTGFAQIHHHAHSMHTGSADIFPHHFSHVFAPFHFYHVLIGMLCSRLCDFFHDALTRFTCWGVMLDALLACWAFSARYGSEYGYTGLTALIGGGLLCVVANGIALNTHTVKADSKYCSFWQSGITGSLLSHPRLVSLADYSFSAYILLQPMCMLADYVADKMTPPLYESAPIGLPFIMAWVMGVLVMPYIEAPFRSAVVRLIPLEATEEEQQSKPCL